MKTVLQGLSCISDLSQELNTAADEATQIFRSLQDFLDRASPAIEFFDDQQFRRTRERDNRLQMVTCFHSISATLAMMMARSALQFAAETMMTISRFGHVGSIRLPRHNRLASLVKMSQFLICLATRLQDVMKEARENLELSRAAADELRQALRVEVEVEA